MQNKAQLPFKHRPTKTPLLKCINLTKDPVIRKRVRITGNSSPLSKWISVISILVIMGCIGIAYFFSDIIQYINKSENPVITKTPSAATHKVTALMNTAGYNTTSSKEKKTVAVADEGVTKLFSDPTNTLQPVSTVIASPSASSNVQSSEPTGTDVPIEPSKSPTIPIKPIATSSTIPSTLAASRALTQSVVTSNQPVTPIVSTESIVDFPETIEQLLAKANTQITKKRFTSPKGDNAYETYQILSEKAPQQAQSILDIIVSWYFEQGKKYISKNKLTKPRQRGNAHKMYQKLIEIAPQHQNTQTLLNDILDVLSQRAKKQFSEDRLVKPRGNNTYETYQEMLTVAPEKRETQRLFNRIINRLLDRAKQQIVKQNFATPKDDNAADTYKQILKISPENIQAQKGINKIVNKYYRLALTRKGQGRYKGSMIWITRGLLVAPKDTRLNQLKQEVREKLSK
ncbi:hypothetical protein [Candidatus Parabeggiatoa sp. HSG14]|uniref:tetratricopeptide repeat protein n=1 Tax=Candidatus Parabeggiatoa sp. HSG14 TaxID=3055593 RepID=UPI0025A7DA0F|nr:hypothetical protein [Thiotrichales bacterium HSG14]